MLHTRSTRDDEIGAALRTLPVPPHSPDFFSRLETALESGSPPSKSPRGARGRARPILALAVTATLAAAAGAVATATVQAASDDSANRNAGAVNSSSVTTFEPSGDWNMILTTVDPSIPQDVAVVWVAYVLFASEESTTGFPVNTIRNLPSDGIVMTVIGPREYTGETTFPAAKLPLTIDQGFCSSDEYETQPAPHVSKCLIDMMVGDKLLNVTVWFGTNVPSAALYEQANEELARLLIPEEI
jgi:hypothetical protein